MQSIILSELIYPKFNDNQYKSLIIQLHSNTSAKSYELVFPPIKFMCSCNLNYFQSIFQFDANDDVFDFNIRIKTISIPLQFYLCIYLPSINQFGFGR